MSDKKWNLYLEIMAGDRSLQDAVRSSQSSINKFKVQVQRDFQSIGRVWNSTMGKAMAIGGGLGAGKLLIDSAKLDHTLNQIALSAGKTRTEAHGMKEELASLGTKTGTSTEELAQSFKSLVNYTGSWDAAKESIKAVNTAVAVTGANADQLGQSMSVASEAFHIDLTKPKAAADLLDKMAAMGKGAGGLENVSRLLSGISLRASMSGMDSNSALKFVGVIGNVTKNPEQMNYVAESALRLFTNLRAIRHMHGVKIFDESGHQRNPLLILKEVSEAYKKLDNKAGGRLLNKLFNGDTRAMQGMQAIFKSGALDKLDNIGKTLRESSGELEKKLPGSLDDAEVAAKRLGELLKKAGDDFAYPLNKVFSRTIQTGMDKLNLKEVGGAGMGAATLAAVIASWYGGKLLKELPGGFGKLLGGKAGLVSGVAEGAMMNKMGITPVYVVNFSEMGNSGPGLYGSKYEEYLPGQKLPGPKGIKPWQVLWPVAVGAASGTGIGMLIDAAKNRMENPTAKIEPGLSRPWEEEAGGNMAPSFALQHLHDKEVVAPKIELNQQIFVEGNKAKTRTVTRMGRGHFTTSARIDSTTVSDEE